MEVAKVVLYLNEVGGELARGAILKAWEVTEKAFQVVCYLFLWNLLLLLPHGLFCCTV